MTSTINSPLSNIRRITLISALVFPSIAVLFGTAGWALNVAVAGKPLGRTSNERKGYFHGCVKNNELWFPVEKYSGKLFDKSFVCQIRRLDLKTGVETETGMSVDGESLHLIGWDNDKLYIHSSRSIPKDAFYAFDGSSLQQIGEWKQDTTVLHSWPFVFDGQLTRVHETLNGDFFLHHMVGGKWAEGRQVVLPGFDRIWRADDTFNRLGLIVIQLEGQAHLLLQDDHSLFLYRKGFVFADEISDPVSALTPENSVPDVTGWNPIPGALKETGFIDIGGDRHGILLSSRRNSGRVLWRQRDGDWDAPKVFEGPENHEDSKLLAQDFNTNSYILEVDNFWNSAVFHVIDENGIRLNQLRLPDDVATYLLRAKLLFAGMLLAWLLHIAYLARATVHFTRVLHCSDYQFGAQGATLSTAWRRTLALAIDVILLLAVIYLVLSIQWWGLGMESKIVTAREFCDWVFNIERDLAVYGQRQGESIVARVYRLLFGTNPNPLEQYWLIIIIGLIEAILLWSLRIYAEGRFGITPGKWLLGIRTLRTTLRPCGFARALVRDLLYWIDVPLLVSPIPAAISMTFSPQTQRLGDRIADTIVVNAESIRGKARYVHEGLST